MIERTPDQSASFAIPFFITCFDGRCLGCRRRRLTGGASPINVTRLPEVAPIRNGNRGPAPVQNRLSLRGGGGDALGFCQLRRSLPRGGIPQCGFDLVDPARSLRALSLALVRRRA